MYKHTTVLLPVHANTTCSWIIGEFGAFINISLMLYTVYKVYVLFIQVKCIRFAFIFVISAVALALKNLVLPGFIAAI